ncbi:hypothetical protein M9458_008449, partial [Cirrhinus mrigala]
TRASNTSHQKHGMREPMNVRFSCRKMHFSTGLRLLLMDSLLEMEMKIAGQSLEFGS